MKTTTALQLNGMLTLLTKSDPTKAKAISDVLDWGNTNLQAHELMISAAMVATDDSPGKIDRMVGRLRDKLQTRMLD